MNILRLDLIAFGPFEQQSLVFEQPRPGLHLVFGPNEAGKSSCRRAIGQWLFGIPHKSTDNFRHVSAKLRIGGLLCNEQGESLEVIRKKGRKDTLRSIDDQTTLPPDALRPFLGGVDVNTFQQRFSLDHQELIRGGQALGVGSELGEVLFAAGTGIADIRTVQTKLQNRIRELFLPGGSVPKINELIRQVADAKTHQRTLMLSAANWGEIEQRLEQAQQQCVTLDTDLRTLRRELRHWERLQRAIPQVARWRACQATLERLNHAPRLPNDFAQRRVQATTSLMSTVRAIHDVEQRIMNLTEKLETVHIQPDLLNFKSLIRSLHAKLSSLQKANHDRSRLVAEQRVAETQMADCQRDWRDYSSGDENRQAVSIGARLRSQLQELASEHASVTERYALCEANVKRLERDLNHASDDHEPPATECDLDDWQLALRPLLKTLDLEQQATAAGLRSTESHHRVQELLQSLPLGPRTIESVVTLPVPLAETIDQFSYELAAIDRTEALTQTANEKAGQQRRDCERELNILRNTDQVPTEAELQATREQRNQLWQTLRFQPGGADPSHQPLDAANASRDTTGIEPGNSAGAQDRASSFDQFWGLTLRSDALADRLRREATRVAQLAQLLADLDVAVAEEQRQAEQMALVQRDRQLWQERWDSLWRRCGLQPLSPREMLTWLRRFHELVDAIHSDRQLQATAHSLSQQAGSAKTLAIELTQRMGSTEPSTHADLSTLVQRCEQQLQFLRLRKQQREQREQRRSDLQAALQDARGQEHAALESRIDWHRRWAEVLSGAGLHPTLAARDLHTMLETYDRHQFLGKELTKYQQRIAGIDRDQNSFDAEVEPLRTLDRRAATSRSEEVVAMLFEQLTRAELDLTRREQWQTQLDEEQEEFRKQDRAKQDWERELLQLCHLAKCESIDELAPIESDGLRRLESERELAEVQRHLYELAEATDLTEFVGQVEQTSADDVDWQITKTQERLHEIETHRASSLELVGRLKRELESLDGNSRAAEAQEDIVHGLASIQHHAQQYIPLRLAAGILDRVIDRYRQANQNGVLARAGQLFAELTLGSFAGVQVELQENNTLQVMGIRPDGTTLVPTSGMSEGTCDQLYLAFRVALLETYLDRHPPIPLLVDDLLITFDDRRSVAALRVLAELARRTQVIFFTHHDRLIELAQQHLSSEQYSVQSLVTGP
ncbi:MAG: AAA family ATPase [Pirellulaceae bacterium]|nr:AAA family ATPase [Pirellulaceae bacterium]